jgi:hypothetical protein
MVTVRTYWNLAEAALAKSLLDNYEVPAALLDENANLYNRGGQFAVPIRLIVHEEDVDRAICILNADFDKAAELQNGKGGSHVQIDDVTTPEKANRNPWELLVIAFYLLVPAICLISTSFPTDVGGRWGRYYVVRVTITRFLSWVAIICAASLIAFYFAVRRSVRKQMKQPFEGG